MSHIEVPLVVGGAIIAAGIIGCFSAMAGQLYERRKWERRLLQRAGLSFDSPAPPAADARENRLEHLENAVDAIALEIERIGEGQRFTTKLLSDRPAAQEPSRKQPREITPH
jgi:hypothetical protein